MHAACLVDGASPLPPPCDAHPCWRREAAKRRGYLQHHQERKAAAALREQREGELIAAWPHGCPVRFLSFMLCLRSGGALLHTGMPCQLPPHATREYTRLIPPALPPFFRFPLFRRTCCARRAPRACARPPWSTACTTAPGSPARPRAPADAARAGAAALPGPSAGSRGRGAACICGPDIVRPCHCLFVLM